MDPRAVLVVTEVDDPTADLVIAELNRRDVPIIRVDPGDFPHTVTMSACVHDARGWLGALSTPTRRAGIGSVRSVYWRRPGPHHSFPLLSAQEARFATAQARHGLTGVLTALPCVYVNHPARINEAEYKPAQLAAAARLGFTLPTNTLITNHPDAARRFLKDHEPVVYKPLVPPEDGVLWTKDVQADEIDDSIAGTAHLFQTRVDKVADVRVTVVGESVFAVRIDGDLLDWRADYQRLTYRVVQPPVRLVRAVHAYLRHFGLVFGAFDFALDRNGTWVWLECNPNGQWAWLEEPTGLPMTEAFADLLERGAR
jgi:ATP-grasp ribosomal peptide maturase